MPAMHNAIPHLISENNGPQHFYCALNWNRWKWRRIVRTSVSLLLFALSVCVYLNFRRTFVLSAVYSESEHLPNSFTMSLLVIILIFNI